MTQTVRGGQVVDVTRSIQHPPDGPFWTRKRPDQFTDEERLQYAALTWHADERMEIARIVKDRHPDVYAPTSEVTLGLDGYEKRRAAAEQLGKTLQLPAIDLEAIDAAAAFVREAPAQPNPLAVSRTQHLAFREVARTGD